MVVTKFAMEAQCYNTRIHGDRGRNDYILPDLQNLISKLKIKKKRAGDTSHSDVLGLNS